MSVLTKLGVLGVLVAAMTLPTTTSASTAVPPPAALTVPTPVATQPAASQPAAGAPEPALTEEELCAGMRRIVLPGMDQCTRGPELMPESKTLSSEPTPLKADVAAATMAAKPIVCEGDGRVGKRVQVMYARETQQPSRLQLFLPSFRAWSHEIDASFNDSAAQTGGSRHVRFVTEAVTGGCRIQVQEVVVPTGGLDTFDATIAALQQQNYRDVNRKYLVFADAQKLCGIGTLYGDDRPGLDNANNRNTSYSRVDASANCWGFNAAGHELGHNLGAVQSTAPHFNGHCTDGHDLMCYGDGHRVVCADKDNARQLDCNKDDYFSTAPPPGSYLAGHWNIANSDWLIKSNVPDARPNPRHGQVHEFVNPATGGVLGVFDASTANLAYVGRQPRTGATSQQWRFIYETGWLLQNVNSSKCADSAFSGSAPGTEILQYTCNGQDGMRWTLHPLGGDVYGILNTRSGLAITDAGSNARTTQQAFTGAANQQWRMRPVPLADGTYRIRSEVGNKDLDVVDCQAQNGADVRMWERVTGSPCQRWQVTSIGGNVYKIVDSNTGKVVEVKGCVTTNAAPVQLWDYIGTDCQQWRIEMVSNGAHKIIGAGSGKSLDVAACSPAAGADVIIWPFHGGACQRWYFDPV